jgi:sporulation protein YlmC with PRC-barrel domain
MIRILLPLICAALGFAAASCSQSEGPFAAAEAPSAPQPSSHGSAAAAMASPSDPDHSDPSAPQPAATPRDQASPPDEASPSSGSQAPQSAAQAEPDAPTSTPAERRASTLIGMPVVSTDGNALGEVNDIIFDRRGQATHLVIAYAAAPEPGPGDTPDDDKPAPGPDGKLTAMPWDAAVASMKDGRVVLDGAKLQNAPSFTPAAWPNLDDPAWSASTDSYWRKAVRAAIAAHPGAPIDSTTRQRGRRTRDGSGNLD